MNYSPYHHPLNEPPKIIEVDAKLIEVINPWSFAAVVLDVICDPASPITNAKGLLGAITFARETFKIANPDINFDDLINKCKQFDEASIRQAQSLIANGFEMLLQQEVANNAQKEIL